MARDRERKASEEKRVRTRASLIYQARALIRKQVALQVREFTTSCLELSAALQRRRWVTNLVLVLTPIVFCFLLLGLSMLIESELGSKNFRCGCKCTACFDWVLIEEDGTSKYEYRYFESTPEKPCLRSSNCQSYDESSCGVQYSKDSQAPLCAIEEPPIYPAFIKVPYEATNGSLVQERTALYTGQNKAYATQLMHQLLPHDQSAAVQFLDLLGGGIQSGINIDPLGILSDPNACLPSGIKFEDRPGNEIGSSTEEGGFTDRQTRKLRQLADSKTGQAFGLLSEELLELVNNFTHTLSDLGIILGTPAASSRSLFIEPALLPVSEQEALYMLLNNCSALSPTQLKGLKKASCTTELMIGRPLECISIDPSWRPDAEDIDYELYCHGDRSPCYTQTRDDSIVKENSTEHISMIYNWKSTRNRHFNVDIRVNYANNFKTDRTPNLQRYNAPLNLATNAFLRQQLKDLDYSVRLYGLKGMPKPETRVTIDFSSLLGPLFFLWLLQLLLPVNVHSLMYEKQNHLRIMMKMQGLDDRVYYTVTYLWQMFIYGCFIAIFIISGSWIGLSIFTKTQLSFQIVFYALWGNVMTAWSFWIASVFKDCKSAVHTVIVWVIGSGLMGSFLLAPFVTQGPTWIAHAMQTVPSFGLYRGVWELAQYSFLASYNAGTGLTWGSLKDNHNGMIRVLITFTIEWFVFLLGAWYNDQVLDNGTGTRRHPLFFFGRSYDKGKNCKESVITFTKEEEPVLTIPETGCPKVDPSFNVSLKFTNPPLRQRSIASKKDSKSGSGKSSSSRSSTSASKVLGGTPIDDSVTGTGSYWGSAESMPASSVPGSPSLLHPDKTTNLHELLQMPMSPVNRSDIEKARLHPSILPTTLELLYFQIARTRTIEASGRLNSGAFCDDDAPDVAMERARVQRIWDSIRLGKDDLDDEAAIVLKNLRKVYPKRGQAYPKVAVDNLSLAISKHECFGLLGPNGAGKTTTIRMMEGFLEQSSGSVSIAGLDTQQDMSTIYSMMGACPQHDLLWNTLTGREHLLFYGRLKNLKGEALTSAVYSSLKSVNLLADAIGDKQVGSYSGGMKRRLSVAISLIGSPLVAYLDEPSTGLDPSSRRLLWDVIKKAKKRTAIVLTTHSMEEAEALCDRLGIFVGGKLQCIGNPKDLTARYGSYLQFSMTTAAGQEEMAAASIYTLCPTARPVYALGGTQKFELPTKDVDLEQVFTHMDELKNNSKISILDWGVSNATLEEVFIKITNDAGVRMTAFT